MKYDPTYGDSRICTCGHTYVLHFMCAAPGACLHDFCKKFTQAMCSCGAEAIHTYYGPHFCGTCASAQFF